MAFSIYNMKFEFLALLNKSKIYDIIPIKTEVLHMNPELTNKAAYDLALEYTRQNNLLKRSTEVTLEQQIENFKKIHNEILKCLNK